ncbi:MAG TPA: sigma-70 family RNA polymerase sigma factor [Bryobacteraceae bacterium]|nr:sigma-70 family RNA polymerase sigma factor [Bryobacteraceae bacterium]
MLERNKRSRFELMVVPHLAAAYNLARWLTRNDHDAEDVVQESYLRAYRFFDGFHGADGRAWILAIVRNACYTWLQQNRRKPLAIEDETLEVEDPRPDPEALHLGAVDQQLLRKAIEELPEEFREAIILRELEGMSYKEIGAITGVPIGTVMSRLARARQRLEKTLAGRTSHGGAP